MTEAALRDWIDRYGRAWEARDPDAAAALFAEEATYQVSPYQEPMRGREAIRAYWACATGGHADVRFEHETLATTPDGGLSRWRVRLRRTRDGRAVDIDGVFLLAFDAAGACTSLREWWVVGQPPQAEPRTPYAEELVSATTDDGLKHDGAVLRPSTGAPKPVAVVWVHGGAGRFNTPTTLAVGRRLAERGYAVVTGNNRGTQLAARLGSTLAGTWFERYAESPRDVAAWVDVAAGLGFGRVVLIGHSYGAHKAVYYQAEREDPRVAGVVASNPGPIWLHQRARERRADPPSPPWAVGEGELADLARRMVAEGRGGELLPWGSMGPGFFTFSAATFLDRFDPAMDTFGLVTADAPASRVRCPVLVLCGGADPFAPRGAELEAVRRGLRAASRVNTTTVEEADHGYTGREDAAAQAIGDWLDGLC